MIPNWTHGAEILAGALLSFLLALSLATALRAAWPLLEGVLSTTISALKFLDEQLVTVGSRITGTARKSAKWRYAQFCGLMLACAVIGAFAPIHLALTALSVGLLGIIAVVRHWYWDEDERSNDIRPTEKRIPIGGDLRGEAVFAISCLLLVMPIGFARLDDAFGMFSALPGWGVYQFLRSPAYVWGELAKALPIIDASEVYGWRNFAGDAPPIAQVQHLTFVLRVAYDLILITSLFQLIDVARRISEGVDLRNVDIWLSSDDIRAQLAAVGRLRPLALKRRANAIARLRRIVFEHATPVRLRFDPVVRILAANGLADCGERSASVVLLHEAITAYRRILKEWPKESERHNWAGAQNNLGTALRAVSNLVASDESLAALRGAIAAYEAAMSVYTSNAAPLDWAMAQNNIGIAYRQISQREQGEAAIEALISSVVAYREALTVYTHGKHAADWAMVMLNLGNALTNVGERLSDDRGLQAVSEAKDAFSAALNVYTRKGFPERWAMVQLGLAIALRVLARRQPEAESLCTIELAIDALHAAETVYTRRAYAEDWAIVQNNLGTALGELGRRTDGPVGIAKLEEAILALRSSLEIRSLHEQPLQWALSQHNLGNGLLALGLRLQGDEGVPHVEEAVEAYKDALTVFEQVGSKYHIGQTREILGTAEAALASKRALSPNGET